MQKPHITTGDGKWNWKDAGKRQPILNSRFSWLYAIVAAVLFSFFLLLLLFALQGDERLLEEMWEASKK